jgi:hypothetical protein
MIKKINLSGRFFSQKKHPSTLLESMLAACGLACIGVAAIGNIVYNKISLHDFYIISGCFFLLNILFSIIINKFEIFNSKYFLHKIYLVEYIYLGVINNINCLYVLYFYFTYMEFQDIKLHVFWAHFIFIILFTSIYMYEYIKNHKKNIKLYYRKIHDIFLLDCKTSRKINKINSPSFMYKPDILVPPVCIYIAILFYKYKMYSKHYGDIFDISVCAGLFLTGTIFICTGIYRLIILSKIKRDTGMDVYSDAFDTLKNDPQKTAAFFALHAKPLQQDDTVKQGKHTADNELVMPLKTGERGVSRQRMPGVASDCERQEDTE